MVRIERRTSTLDNRSLVARRRYLGRIAVILIICGSFRSFSVIPSASALAFSSKGTAASPLQKKKVAVLGSGGYMGAVTFGFLQRAASLYGTGIGNCRCLGATSDTALRLNRILSKHFCLAVADESYIKLTDLYSSVDMVAQRLDGWNALVLGNDLSFSRRPVTANTFEKTPNDKTWELYWGNRYGGTADLPVETEKEIRQTILQTTLAGARQAGVQHIVAVDSEDGDASRVLKSLLDSSKIPYTLIKCRNQNMTPTKDYTYRKGVQGALSLSLIQDEECATEEATLTPSSIAEEDIAALCVQCLQSLDWSQSRSILVSAGGDQVDASQSRTGKRPDQEWCVNSVVLEERLATIA